MKFFRRKNIGVTLIEIIIVAAISAGVMTMAFLLMRKSTSHFQKGTKYLDVQSIIENIVERLRTDVRSLKYVLDVVPKGSGERPAKEKSELCFVGLKGGESIWVYYRYDDKKKTLFRQTGAYNSSGSKRFQGGKNTSRFYGMGKIEKMTFDVEKDDYKNFKYLNITLRIKSQPKGKRKERGDEKASLAVICQFYSTCVESGTSLSQKN
jgi:hypothetical protein